MAADGLPEDIAHEEESQLLICCVCRCRLQDPVLLGCLHGCCKMCAVTIGQKGSHDGLATCPACGASVDVEQAREDIFIASQLRRSAASSGSIECDSCKEDSKLEQAAECWCETCQQTLCTTCLVWHDKFLRDHKVLSLRGSALDPELASFFSLHTLCRLHGAKVNSFCFSCEGLQCPDCRKPCAEAKHETISLEGSGAEQYIVQLKEKIVAEQSLLTDMLASLNARRADSDGELQPAHSADVERLKKHKAAIISAVDSAYEEAEDELRVKYEELSAEASDAIKEGKAVGGMLERCLVYSRTFLAKADNAGLVYQQRPLLSHLRWLGQRARHVQAMPDRSKHAAVAAALPESIDSTVRQWFGLPLAKLPSPPSSHADASAKETGNRSRITSLAGVAASVRKTDAEFTNTGTSDVPNEFPTGTPAPVKSVRSCPPAVNGSSPLAANVAFGHKEQSPHVANSLSTPGTGVSLGRPGNEVASRSLTSAGITGQPNAVTNTADEIVRGLPPTSAGAPMGTPVHASGASPGVRDCESQMPLATADYASGVPAQSTAPLTSNNAQNMPDVKADCVWDSARVAAKPSRGPSPVKTDHKSAASPVTADHARAGHQQGMPWHECHAPDHAPAMTTHAPGKPPGMLSHTANESASRAVNASNESPVVPDHAAGEPQAILDQESGKTLLTSFALGERIAMPDGASDKPPIIPAGARYSHSGLPATMPDRDSMTTSNRTFGRSSPTLADTSEYGVTGRHEQVPLENTVYRNVIDVGFQNLEATHANSMADELDVGKSLRQDAEAASQSGSSEGSLPLVSKVICNDIIGGDQHDDSAASLWDEDSDECNVMELCADGTVIKMTVECADIAFTAERGLLVAAGHDGLLELDANGSRKSFWTPPEDLWVGAVECLDDGRVVVGFPTAPRLAILHRHPTLDDAWQDDQTFQLPICTWRVAVHGVKVVTTGKPYHSLLFGQPGPGSHLVMLSATDNQCYLNQKLMYPIWNVALTARVVVALSYGRHKMSGGSEMYLVDAYTYKGELQWRHGSEERVAGVCAATSGKVLYLSLPSSRRIMAINADDGHALRDILNVSSHYVESPAWLSLYHQGTESALAVLSMDRYTITVYQCKGLHNTSKVAYDAALAKGFAIGL